MPLPPGTLNQALDQLPQLLLNLGRLQQDRRDEEMRREIQQASQVFESKMLERRIAAEKELVDFRAGLELPEDPPEVAILGRRIEKDLDILRDPNTALTYGEEDINVIKNRVISTQAEIRRQSGRDYYVAPALIRAAPAKPPPPPGAALGPPPAKTESEIELEKLVASKRTDPAWMARIARAEARVARGKAQPPALAEPAAVEEIPPEFPDPSGFPEGQTATYNGEPWIILNGQWVKGK